MRASEYVDDLQQLIDEHGERMRRTAGELISMWINEESLEAAEAQTLHARRQVSVTAAAALLQALMGRSSSDPEAEEERLTWITKCMNILEKEVSDAS
jgi:hypothetical protein